MKKILLLVLFGTFAVYNSMGQSVGSLYFKDNPAKKTDTINFTVFKTDTLTLTIYDRWGNNVFEPLNDSVLNPGAYSILFDTKALQSGIYIYYFRSSQTNLKGHLDINNITTSIKNIENNSSEINVYPNPANGNFVIETNITKQQLLQVFDVTGKLMVTENIQNGRSTIDASNLSQGVYNVCVTSSGGRINKGLIIVK